MNTKQTLINHLIKTLAEQLRKADEAGLVTNKNGTVGASKEKAAACKAASKAVAELEKLGVDYNTAYDKADLIKVSPVEARPYDGWAGFPGCGDGQDDFADYNAGEGQDW